MTMSDIVCLLSQSTGKIVRARKGELSLKRGDLCVVESDFGGDLAAVVDHDSPVCRNPKTASAAVQVIRKATDDDIGKFEWLWEREQRAFHLCRDRIKFRRLPMKLVAVRYFFDEKKGVFFYTADGRIDFRQLVKDLAKELRMRIEMRQVGVRDEARIMGGLGVCGRSLCCFSFIRNFEPVTIQKARRQQIAINPTKISGLCGRLMCCLGFEDETRGRIFTTDDNASPED